MLRLLAGVAVRLVARLLNRTLRYQYQPGWAHAQFQDLRHILEVGVVRPRDWNGRGSRGHARTISQSTPIPARASTIKRSRQIVLSRHMALLDKYRQYIIAFMPIAQGKIYQDEYGDEIWEGAEREIERIIDDKVFKRENIRDRDEFYSFEFLSRCEPAFGSEYSDCWIFDELYDRLKAYHQTRLHSFGGSGRDGPRQNVRYRVRAMAPRFDQTSWHSRCQTHQAHRRSGRGHHRATGTNDRDPSKVLSAIGGQCRGSRGACRKDPLCGGRGVGRYKFNIHPVSQGAC